MVTSTSLRLIAVTSVFLVAGAIVPTSASSEKLSTLLAPRSLDQTVYLPTCQMSDCDCGCDFDIACQPDCDRWSPSRAAHH